jgi:tetratricopeptide (TPR) repeat protein
MTWSYPYAIPSGLVYRINPTPLKEIPKEDVKKDMDFWAKYTIELLSNPRFCEDEDARNSFAKLRETGGNIYRFRGMKNEAEIAYHEALALAPTNPEVVNSAMAFYLPEKKFDKIIAITERAAKVDPLNEQLINMVNLAKSYKQIDHRNSELQDLLKNNPKDLNSAIELLKNYFVLGDTNDGNQLVKTSLKNLSKQPDIYQESINYYVSLQRWKDALEVARDWSKMDPNNPEVTYTLSRFLFKNNLRDEFLKTAAKAIQQGGITIKQRYVVDELFQSLTFDSDFQKLLR